jgi:replication factor A1
VPSPILYISKRRKGRVVEKAKNMEAVNIGGITMELEEIIKKIVGDTGMKEEEVQARIDEKQKELGGLVTPIGAAHIIANEAGINLLEGLSKEKDLKVENIIPGMGRVDVVGRVTRIFPAREFERKDKSTGRVASAILADETGSIRVVFWDKYVDLLEEGKIDEGDVLRIKKAYTKENINGEPEVHLGIRARVIINPKDVAGDEMPLPEGRRKKINELEGGMGSIDLVVRVLRIYDVREFEREDKTRGKVVNLQVGDETGAARLVLWDEDVSLVEDGKIAEGDVLKIIRGYVKLRFGEPEVNVGRYGKVVINPGEEVGETPGVRVTLAGGGGRKRISDLHEGDKGEVRGALVEVYENLKVFDRKDGKGMVVNAVVDDGTGSMRAAFYDKMAEALLNITLAEATEGDVEEKIRKRRKEILGREVVVTVSVRHNDFTGREELLVLDLNLNPDPKKEAEELLKEVKLMEGE